MKKLKITSSIVILSSLLLMIVLSSCQANSTPKDLQPIIEGQFKDAKSVYYPSTDYKAAAIIIDKQGNVWYLRMNGVANMRDKVQLFNVSEFCN